MALKCDFRTGHGHTVLDDCVERIRELRAEREHRLRAIRTRSQALQYQEQVRRKLRRIFGPMPKKTPLKARVTGVLEKRDVRIEKVLFESRPGFLVTANLYLPKNLSAPAPGVVGSCGHHPEGKACPAYQSFCRELAANGFVVLIFDPFGQGERFLAEKSGGKFSPVDAHTFMGRSLELLGESFCAWRAWDGIRALDYLRSRPEVDASRIGLTGNSGGGTMSTWIWGLEKRFSMVAPSCFVTTYLSNLENELPQDSEQYPPGLFAAGLDIGDCFLARAPEPVILIGQRYCFFDRRGLEETYEEVRRFYRLFGAGDRVRHFLGAGSHGYHADGRAAMVAFFGEMAGMQGPVTKKRFVTLAADQLSATSEASVVAEGSRTICGWTSERAGELERKRARLSKEETRKRVSRLLQVKKPRVVPHYRVLPPDRVAEQAFGRYAVETEGSIRAILWRRITGDPTRAFSLEPERELVLYLPHVSSELDLAAGEVEKTLLPLYALDPRGMGESFPDDDLDRLHKCNKDHMLHGFGLMRGRSYLGQRVADVLSTMHLLQTEGGSRIHLWGRGQGALLALFAAVLYSETHRVRLKNCPVSCIEWTQKPAVQWPSASFVRGLLRELDLPDCLRALGAKVKITQPWNAE